MRGWGVWPEKLQTGSLAWLCELGGACLELLRLSQLPGFASRLPTGTSAHAPPATPTAAAAAPAPPPPHRSASTGGSASARRARRWWSSTGTTSRGRCLCRRTFWVARGGTSTCAAVCVCGRGWGAHPIPSAHWVCCVLLQLTSPTATPAAAADLLCCCWCRRCRWSAALRCASAPRPPSRACRRPCSTSGSSFPALRGTSRTTSCEPARPLPLRSPRVLSTARWLARLPHRHSAAAVGTPSTTSTWGPPRPGAAAQHAAAAPAVSLDEPRARFACCCRSTRAALGAQPMLSPSDCLLECLIGRLPAENCHPPNHPPPTAQVQRAGLRRRCARGRGQPHRVCARRR